MAGLAEENGNGNGVWFRWTMGLVIIAAVGALSFLGAEIHGANSTIEAVNTTLLSVNEKVGYLSGQLANFESERQDVITKVGQLGNAAQKLDSMSAMLNEIQAAQQEDRGRLGRLERQSSDAAIRLDHLEATTAAIHANQVLAPVTHRKRGDYGMDR